MENLLALVDKIQQISPLPVFAKEVFVVQNAGMQHWLNMSLAERRGISLNIDYALPAQFLWGLVRSLVNKGEEVEQAPFSREAMCWRIFQLLTDKCVVEDEDFASVTQYWHSESSASANLKRYQLACQLADLFEQYLVFRPDWINTWQAGNLTDHGCNNFASLEKWQAKLWLLLVEHQDYNPVQLLLQATKNLDNYAHIIPKRLCFFGINAMAPMWLSFINALSEVTEVHFFHLNPCVDYWGDILSEKQAIKNSYKWTENHQLINDSVGNPLLANLGQQGREFLVLLQQYSMVNIEAFESTLYQPADMLTNDEITSEVPSVLSHIQDDILTLSDARTAPKKLKDDSIVITSAHSALREVQGLHDWLLHQFNNDPTLTPKDVLVMCPQVEMYAPYVNAVFARGWQELDSDIPPLPCSISDRVAKDSEPLVAAFSELLTLPDSRFQVSQILAWLRLPAMQLKFGLHIEDIEKYTMWVEHACIHWGLNTEHKQHILATEQVAEQFTWQYGLSRLLQGFAYSDKAALYQGKSVLPNVEGSDGVLLGKLMLVIEQLQYFTAQLNNPRAPQEWHQFLLSLIEDMFETSNEEGFNSVFSAIESFVEYCQHANFSEKIELTILREFLNGHFSQPDPGRQFMVGQVTFCSMLPMRSIPFKIVAVLGLNDGEYPRQRAPLGFDLMSLSQSRIGDRSRRGDDRYLFLEAIISARQALYLSYQGRSIKNNNQRQPSIVLKELMDYLQQAYNWQLLADNNVDLRQLAMQPYSEKNYIGKYAGFDKKWLALSPKHENRQESHNQTDRQQTSKLNNQALVIDADECQKFSLTLNDLTRFFTHPSRYFAQTKLALYLDNYDEQLLDIEPFDSDHLSRYLFKEQVLSGLLNDEVSTDVEAHALTEEQLQARLIDTLKQQASLSGKFPQLPQQQELLDKLVTDSVNLAQFIEEHNASNTQVVNLTITHEFSFFDKEKDDESDKEKDEEANDENERKSISYTIDLSTKINFCAEKIVSYRSSLPKIKDFLGLYLNMLIVEIWLEQQSEPHLNSDTALIDLLSEIKTSHGFYFDSKSQKTVQYYYPYITDPKQQLTELLNVFIQGQSQALLLNSDLAQVFYKAKMFEQQHFEQFWLDDNNQQAFGSDPYIQFFWPKCPAFNEIQPQLTHVYDAIINHRQQVK
mgnify:CR=1 FL=1